MNGPRPPCVSPWRRLLACAALLIPVLSATAAAAEPFRIATSSWVGDAPTRIAEAQGWFAAEPDADDPIVLVHEESGRDALQRMLAGDAELALAADTPVAIALRKQPPGGPRQDDLVVLASVGLANRTHFIVANAGAGISEPEDLAGHRLGVTPGTSSAFTWDRFLDIRDIEADAVELVHGPQSELRDRLRQGDIDAAVLWEPWSSMAREELGERAAVFTVLHRDAMTWLIVTRREVAHTRSSALERALRGYQRAIEFIYGSPPEARRVYANATEVAPQVMARMDEDMIWSLSVDGTLLATLQARLDWLRDRSGEDRPPIPPGRYLLPGPLSRIAPSAVGVPAYLLTLPSPDSGGAAP